MKRNKKHTTPTLSTTDYAFSVNLCRFFGIEYLIMFVERLFFIFVSLLLARRLFGNLFNFSSVSVKLNAAHCVFLVREECAVDKRNHKRSGIVVN